MIEFYLIIFYLKLIDHRLFYIFFIPVLLLILNNSAYAKDKKIEYPKIWNVPDHNKDFTGRSDILKFISKEFKINDSTMAIVGTPGVGKTQIAKRYALLNKNKYDIIWWMDGRGNITEQYRTLAAMINIQLQTKNKLPIYASENIFIEQLKNYLRTTEFNWLLIFDNVANYNIINHYIPMKHNQSLGNVLITSQNLITWKNMIKIKKLDRPESIEYLNKALKANKSRNTIALNELADLLGDYPVALSQAVGYINNSRIDVEEYITLFNSPGKELWNAEKKIKDENGNVIEFDHYSGNIFGSLSLSVMNIKKQSKTAFDLLALCSLLDKEGISEDFLYFIAKLAQQDRFTFIQSLTKLYNYSILNENISDNTININSNVGSSNAGGNVDSNIDNNKQSIKNTYSIHNLMQLVVLDLVTEQEQKTYLSHLQQAMAKYLPDQIEMLAPLIESNLYLLNHIKKINFHAAKLNQVNQDNITILIRLLEYYVLVTLDYKSANKLIFEITEKINESKTKVDEVLLAQFYHAKSIYYSWCESDKDSAIIEAKKALALLKFYPEQIDNLLNVYLQLTQSYIFKCDVDNAMIYLNEAEKLINNGKNNNQSVKIVLFYAVKAVYHMNIGDFEKALKENKLAIEIDHGENIREKSPGELPFYLLESEILLKQGKYQEALDKTKEMLSIAKDFYKDEEHELTSRIMIILSGAAIKLGRLELAKNNISKAIEIMHLTFAENNVTTPDLDMANALVVLGDIQAYEQDYLLANENYLKAEAMFKRLFVGAKTDDVSYLYSRLAINSANLNDRYQVEYYLKAHKDKFGLSHPRTNEIIEYVAKKEMKGS